MSAQLYKRVCPSVGPLVCWSVGPLVGPSETVSLGGQKQRWRTSYAVFKVSPRVLDLNEAKFNAFCEKISEVKGKNNMNF